MDNAKDLEFGRGGGGTEVLGVGSYVTQSQF